MPIPETAHHSINKYKIYLVWNIRTSSNSLVN